MRAGSGLKEEVHLDVKGLFRNICLFCGYLCVIDDFLMLFSECKTGDVKVTSGHNLAARYIIHTVGPKYTAKYHTAAENTLHMCYRYYLQIKIVKYKTLFHYIFNIRIAYFSILLPSVAVLKCNSYPRYEPSQLNAIKHVLKYDN